MIPFMWSGVGVLIQTSLFVMVIAGAVVLETGNILTQRSKKWVLSLLKMSRVASKICDP